MLLVQRDGLESLTRVRANKLDNEVVPVLEVELAVAIEGVGSPSGAKEARELIKLAK